MKEDLMVFKIGGGSLDNPEQLHTFLNAFSGIKHKKILIHGGGKMASAMGKRLGIESEMIEGRRVTSADTLDLVTMVYGGLINKKIVATLQSMGCNALGLTGADASVIVGKKRSSFPHDYGFVGDLVPHNVNRTTVAILLTNGFIPVFCPLITDGSGGLLNTNADTVAAAVAASLAVDYRVSLYFCFEKEGVLGQDGRPLSTLNIHQFEALRAAQVVHLGMVPKLENAFMAKKEGVDLVKIIPTLGYFEHDAGKGTTILS